MFYKIYYDKIELLEVINFIDSNTTKNSLAIFLKELYISYFSLITHFINSLDDKDIELALDLDFVFTTIHYVELTEDEKVYYLDDMCQNYRIVNGNNLIYGLYSLRNRITTEKKNFMYIDDMVLNYYTPYISDGIKGLDNLVYFKQIYKNLISIYKEAYREQEKDEYNLYKRLLEEEPSQTDNQEIEEIKRNEYKITNPYPLIFSSDYAYGIFLNFLNTYENEKNHTANFSFLFHAMKKDALIHKKAKGIDYIEMLSEKDIHIDKVKTYSTIGNKTEKHLAYKSLKFN